jgi:LacI family transcriptional regulator
MRVKAAAEELGYRADNAASTLRTGKSMALGVITADLENPCAAPIIRGIENSLEGRGYLAYITETQDDRARLARVIDNLLSRRVDAIITMASSLGDEHILRSAARRIPVVLAVRDLPGINLAGVVHDDERGGRLAAEHLLSLGHRRVAQLVGPQDISSFVGRRVGFEGRMAQEGATIVTLDRVASHPIFTQGQVLASELLKQHKVLPTAIFAHNDLMALGAVQVLRAAGLRCPEDISIIGYNNSPLTEFTDPPLTTITLPGYELGRFSADLALSLIDGRGTNSTVLSLPPQLIVRKSTGAPANRN